MNLFWCFIEPFVKVFRSSAEKGPQPAQESSLVRPQAKALVKRHTLANSPQRIDTQLGESTNNLIPAVSIRTPTERDSLLAGDELLLTPNGYSSSRSPGRNSPPWPKERRLSRSRTSSNGSFDGDSLKAQIRNARIKCSQRPHCYIVPKSALESLITVANIEKDIKARSVGIEHADVGDIAEKTFRNAKKVFAILAYMKMGPEIRFLLEDGVSDADLPLEWRRNDDREFVLERESGVPIETFKHWTDDNIEDFERYQWWMLVTVFEDKKHYELDDNSILPFIPFKTNAETEKIKEGAYSEVYPVRCHPAHHSFWECSRSEQEEPLIAIKKLFSSEESEFQKEVTILKALGSKAKPHPHLIKLLATYRQKTKYHLMFPYADANLRTYWDERPLPKFDEATVIWSLKQMAGIASALNSIHNFTVTVPLSVDGPGNVRVQDDAKLSVVKKEELYGRHGDIKPENVLWFRQCPETDDENGILQIADFGLGRFHGRDSRSRVPPDSVLGSPTYEPPECKLHRPVSRAYDIWSLGCLYLEFITWLLKGSDSIEGFSDFRGKTGKGSKEGLNDDYFFTIIKISNVESDAVVRDEVIDWVDQLHEHEKCSALIHDLLDLIMNEVLLTNASKRIDARWLFHQLKSCLNKAKEDKIYLLQAVPRQKKLSSGRSNSTPTVLDATQTSNKKVTFTRQDKPLPLTAAHRNPPKDLVQRGPATPGLSRAQTHRTWPTTGSSAGPSKG